MSGDAIHPTGPSQPTLNQAYTTPGNPVEAEPAEKQQASLNAHTESASIDHRVPSEQASSQSQAMPTPVAYGVRGAPPGEESKGYTQEQMGKEQELDADQMAAPGESKIRDAVMSKPGASGGEQGLETDLDRKKREQAPMREKVEQEKQQSVDVGGILGQRGGPANPVDKDNYPNTGS